MNLARIPLFGLGLSGKSVTECAQSRLNFYPHRPSENDKAPLVFYPTPCLSTSVSLSGGAGPAAAYYWHAKGYVVVIDVSRRIYTFGGSVATDTTQTMSVISGSVPDHYDMADGGDTLLIASWLTGGAGLIHTWSGSGAPTSRTFPTGVTAFGSVTWLDGYYIGHELGSGRLWLSDLEDPTTWSDTSFATAESSPDNLTRVIAHGGRLLLIGESTTEFWQNTGAASFPFAPLRGATIPIGSPARKSVAVSAAGVFMLAQQPGGKKQVALISGTNLRIVSNPELETLMESYTTASDATGFAYTQEGHTFYQIKFPSHSVTWLYDLNTNSWSKRSSPTGGGAHDAKFGVEAFGKVWVGGSTAKLFPLAPGVYTDDGTEPVRHLVSRHVFADYNLLTIDSVYVDIEPITGAPENATVGLEVSRDGGKTFGAERKVTLASGATRASWHRLGRARDFVLRFNFPALTDQGENTGNKWVVLGGAMKATR